ncbi:hypothetical protein GQ53DRAFT_391100 [Thozetella sp. PMI_491]|nr:hypothetical protein GQ53DRAFT_391100 [Thozetella sp. PMI_491]
MLWPWVLTPRPPQAGLPAEFGANSGGWDSNRELAQAVDIEATLEDGSAPTGRCRRQEAAKKPWQASPTRDKQELLLEADCASCPFPGVPVKSLGTIISAGRDLGKLSQARAEQPTVFRIDLLLPTTSPYPIAQGAPILVVRQLLGAGGNKRPHGQWSSSQKSCQSHHTAHKVKVETPLGSKRCPPIAWIFVFFVRCNQVLLLAGADRGARGAVSAAKKSF